TLMVRTSTNGLPAANAAIDFDQPPFVTQGFTPDGHVTRYYNFDVRPTAPAPIYVLIRAGSSTPLAGQLNIVDVIPGDAGYNDFWQVNEVTVPATVSANQITSFADIHAAGYPIKKTDHIVNCPIVPMGSTAKERTAGQSADLDRGWYRGQVVHYFSFEMN